MAKAKKVRVRVNPGLLGLDAVQVTKTVLITKIWTEVSPTLAKKLVGLEHKGRPKFEFEEADLDKGEVEDPSEEATEAE